MARNETKVLEPSQSLNGQLVTHPARRSENMKLETLAPVYLHGRVIRKKEDATYSSVRERKKLVITVRQNEAGA